MKSSAVFVMNSYIRKKLYRRLQCTPAEYCHAMAEGFFLKTWALQPKEPPPKPPRPRKKKCRPILSNRSSYNHEA